MAPYCVLPSFFDDMINVRVLQLHLAGIFNQAPLFAFLQRCNCLEELDLTDYDDFETWTSPSARTVFSHLGKTLKKLRLHGSEPPDTPKTYIGKKELGLLAEVCPRVTSLGLDLRQKDFREAEVDHETDATMHNWVSFGF